MIDFEKIIAYEDDHILIVDKPIGVASQAERSYEEDLLSATLNYFAARKRATKAGTRADGSIERVYAAVINRLDKPVGGLVLFAKDEKTAALLSAATGDHKIEKFYYAVVSGEVTGKGEYTDYLVKDGRANISRAVKPGTPNARKALLAYEALTSYSLEGERYTLLRVRLYTGRHHQIRVQMAAHGHPLYGDLKYNPAFADRREVSPALYAYHLSFHNPYGADTITVESLPKSGHDGPWPEGFCLAL